MLAIVLLLTAIDAPPPARERVAVTHDLETLTDEQAMRLTDGRHRFRVVRDSDPDEIGGCVCFDCAGPEEGHRSVRFRKGDTADGEMTEGLVEARVRVLLHRGWGPFPPLVEVRLVDAVPAE